MTPWAADDPSAKEVEIQALAVAMDILDYLASHNGRRSAAEIARALEMTPPRVWRHLNSMAALGLVDGSAETRGFSLGPKLARLGQRALGQMNLVEAAMGPLSALRDLLGESVYLAVPYEDHATVVASLPSPGPIALRLANGVVFSSSSSAAGRVIMAFSSTDQIDSFITGGELDTGGHNPITNARELRERYQLIRDRFHDTAATAMSPRPAGFVFFNAIAAPIFDHANQIAGAIGLLTGIREDDVLTAGPIREPLFAAARRISTTLGSTRWDDRP